MKAKYLLLLSVIVLSACGVTQKRMEILKPADITVPKHINNFVFVNRTVAKKGNRFGSFLEGAITGEVPYADRQATKHAFGELNRILNESPRFEGVQRSVLHLEGSGHGNTTNPLHWNYVDQLCKENGVSAIIALEAFDTDAAITCDQREVIEKDTAGNKYSRIIFEANLQMNYKAVWTLYDPKKRQIIDFWRNRGNVVVTADGPSARIARNNLPDKTVVAEDLGRDAGHVYGDRVAPRYVLTTRTIYTSAKKNRLMKEAGQLCLADEWEQAINLWHEITQTEIHPKIVKRAHYNLAVGYEMMGELETAIKHVNIAKNVYNFGAEYCRLLQERRNDEYVLDKQFGLVD